MRNAAFPALLVVACGAPQSPNGVDRGWFCAHFASSDGRTSQCYRSRDDCNDARTPPGFRLTGMCAPEPIAYCVAPAPVNPIAPSDCYATSQDCADAMGAPQCAATN
jgi:hypothetical protein